MADEICVSGLRVLAFCGLLPEEIARRQPFEIDLVVSTDVAHAGQTDELDDTIDYGGLCESIASIAERDRFNLLERFATVIAETVLESSSAASAVQVTVRKLRPPVPHHLDSSGVRIVRTRGG